MSIQLKDKPHRNHTWYYLHYRLLSPPQMFNNNADNPSKYHIGQHTGNKRLHKSPPDESKGSHLKK